MASKYVRFPSLAKMKPFSAGFLNKNKDWTSPFLEVILYQGTNQFDFLFLDVTIPCPDDPEFLSDSALQNMLDNINSKPLWHLLDSAILEIFENAYQTHLKPYINLFGMAFVSCDKWNAQHKECVAEIETKAGEWVENVCNTWEGHPKELSVLSQFLM